LRRGDGDVAIKANIDIGLGGAAAQVAVAREIQGGLFFVPVIQRQRFRIERTPDGVGIGIGHAPAPLLIFHGNRHDVGVAGKHNRKRTPRLVKLSELFQMQAAVFDCALVQLISDLQAFFRGRVADCTRAEDLAQETILKAYRARDTLRDPCRLKAWIYGIARRTLADHYRNISLENGRRRQLPSNARPDNLSKVREVLVCATRCYLDTLPHKYRDPVHLAEYEGCSHVEVARRTGVSLAAAKSRVRRGKIMVRRLMEAECQFQYDMFGNVIGYRVRPEVLASRC
jgi:RNA polymerase sigma-70 factor, ECF subfamily